MQKTHKIIQKIFPQKSFFDFHKQASSKKKNFQITYVKLLMHM